ncbi:uncharacterized protein LOC141906329 [Tubulanus polymorphus]|uniref:uncharacterized protein LOC141906329 n=1 Tax=Tubulanus polymorphus TaxID=672921 RepID=UPI003DA38E61
MGKTNTKHIVVRRELGFKYAGMEMVDFTEILPKEIIEKIFSYLNPKDLCHLSRCSHSLRINSNQDHLWLHHCLANGWLKYGLPFGLLDQPTGLYASVTNISGTSPVFSYEGVGDYSTLEPVNKWKQIYMRAQHLKINWKTGRYSVAPTLRGHTDKVNAFDCNSQVIVSAGEDKTLRVWDLHTCKCINKLNVNGEPLTAVKIKGNVLVVGCYGGGIHVYDSSTLQKKISFQGHHSSIDHMAFDGNIIISVAADRAMMVWDIKCGELKYTMRGHTDDVESFAVHGTLVATGGYDNLIMIWNTETGQLSQRFEGHTEVINAIQFDQKKLVSASSDSTLRIWTINDGLCQFILRGHMGEVFCVAYNEHVITSGGTDSCVIVWDHTGCILKVFNDGHIGTVRCLHIDNEKLISGGDQKRIVIWDWKDLKILNRVHRNPNILYKLWVGDTRLITASPEKPGLMTMISYW